MGERSPRFTAAVTGAILGGLIWAGLDELGLWAALKFNFYIGPLAVAMIIGAIAAMTQLRRALWVGAGLILAALLIVSYTPIAGPLVRPLVRADPLPSQKLDAIVVLSGGLTADGAMGSETLDRLHRGAELIRDGKASVLVLSRESRVMNGRSVSDSADEARALQLTGVNVPVFFIDSVSSTHDEALRIKRHPAAAAWSRIGLVTSPLHTRRACAVFERAGFIVTCIPAVSRDRSITNLDAPSDRLRAFQGWLYELAGTTDYRIKGWI